MYNFQSVRYFGNERSMKKIIFVLPIFSNSFYIRFSTLVFCLLIDYYYFGYFNEKSLKKNSYDYDNEAINELQLITLKPSSSRASIHEQSDLYENINFET
jgi:hypothetical protein